MIKKHWWKALGVLILIYTFVVGMLVPLRPGIANVSPGSVSTGESVNFNVRGYNSNFEQGQPSIRAWLKLDDDRALAATAVEATSEVDLIVSFNIPEYLPVRAKVQDLSLIIDNEIDGASVMPSAVFVTQDSIDPAMGQKTWVNSKISRLHSIDKMTFPFRNILSETIRNTYFHVPLWMAMMLIFIGSFVYSIKYLRKFNPVDDTRAQALNQIGLFYGVLGILTGAVWAKHTWGAYWSWDVKQNMTAIALLIYAAYFILRNSFEDQEKQARISAVYNIFAFSTLIPLLYVIPRMTDSLHPGNGGNPAFGSQDLDNTMRMVFYPAVIGWTLIGLWISNLVFRIDRLKNKLLEV
jgi:heme exporter protein C